MSGNVIIFTYEIDDANTSLEVTQVTYKKSTLSDVLCGVEESRGFIGHGVFSERADGFHRQTFRAELLYKENLIPPDSLIRKVKYSFQPVNLPAA